MAAADSGSRESLASIQAHTEPSRVLDARAEIAMLVRPEEVVPVISVMAPTGIPPLRRWSIGAMPVGTTSRIVFGEGVRTEG